MAEKKKKKPKSLLVISGLGLIGIGFVLAVIQLSSTYLDNQSNKTSQTIHKCTGENHPVHEVLIQDNKAVPKNTSAVLCDKLIITNLDDKVKLMAFGEHDNHQPYDGVTEKLLQRGQDLTVTLNQVGTFTFHDHIGDQAHGGFTVSQTD